MSPTVKRTALIGGACLCLVVWQIYRALSPVLDGLRQEFPAPELAATEPANAPDLTATNALPLGATPSGSGIGVPDEHPAALEGTEPDGMLEADSAGHLKLNLGVRRYFDYFLMSTGEMSEARLDAWVQARIGRSLPQLAADEARLLWQRYGKFRAAVRGLPAMPGANSGPEALEASWQRITALQRQHFSDPERDAFFAAENAQNAAAFRRRKARVDSQLAPEPVAAAEPNDSDEAGPPVLTDAAQVYLEAEARAGGHPESLHGTRNRLLGVEVIDRLKILDDQRRVWQDRVANFERARAAILAQPSLADTERTQRVQDLLNQNFSETERLRVQATQQAGDEFPAD